ncbi:MAG: alpha/beta hydrolase, partial [Acutalibacteraceae bacterium]
MREVFLKLADKFWKMCEKSDNKLHASQTEPEGIERICDIDYAGDGDRYHLLDVYYPEGTSEKLPVIIDIHGGGWMYGDKDLNKMYCLNLAKRGFVVFNISYRLVPTVTVNEQLQDVALALRWISENMKDYPCVKDEIMLTGDSAGGQLASFSAILMTSSELREIFRAADCGLKLTALALTSPVTDMNVAGP